MLKLSQPITSINGFKIGDIVRLKDGDGRPHFIKSFSIDGIKEFFFVVQFVDGTEAMLNNISPLPSNLDEAAEKNFETMKVLEHENIFEETHNRIFKAGAEWMAGQGETIDGEITTTSGKGWEVIRIPKKLYPLGTKVIVQIRKK